MDVPSFLNIIIAQRRKILDIRNERRAQSSEGGRVDALGAEVPRARKLGGRISRRGLSLRNNPSAVAEGDAARPQSRSPASGAPASLRITGPVSEQKGRQSGRRGRLERTALGVHRSWRQPKLEEHVSERGWI